MTQSASISPNPNQAIPHAGIKIWTGRIMSGIIVLFFLGDSVPKIFRASFAVEATTKLGFPGNLISVIGVILFTCTVLYLIPRTSVLGAILLTGYLGGAIATQASAGTPLFSNVLFPLYLGILLWGGIYLRNDRIRQFIPVLLRK